jgi:L-fuculose-phosphate aldolase
MTPAAFRDADRAALADAARLIAGRGLVIGSAGNLSLRRGGCVLITTRGARLEALGPDDCAEVDLCDGAVSVPAPSGARPSSETALHRAAYAATGGCAIVHTHSHYATVLGTLVDELPGVHYVVTAFGGPVRVAPYETFGTDALAAAVAERLEGRRAALMANHGAIVVGRDLDHAVELAFQLEWLASVYYHALVVGSPSILTEAELDAVRERAHQLRQEVEVGAR